MSELKRHTVLLLRINRLYRPDMAAEELYEATRGVWRLNPTRHKIEYAFAVYQGVVREVYAIREWYPAGTLPYHTRTRAEVQRPGGFAQDSPIALVGARLHPERLAVSLAGRCAAAQQYGGKVRVEDPPTATLGGTAGGVGRARAAVRAATAARREAGAAEGERAVAAAEEGE